jgi:glycerophosphoryl diester phosphodiesterase
MHVLGHRGSRIPGPENTADAVRGALAAGAIGSEIDVRRSADDALFCIHDPLLASSSRPVIDMTAEELTAAGVPLLSEVVQAGAGGRLVIEVKNILGEPDYSREAEGAQRLMTELERLKPAAQVLISSFDPVSLDVARAAGWPTGLLTIPGVTPQEGLAYVLERGYSELHAHVSTIGPDGAAARAVHDAGLSLAVWTVTTLSEVEPLRASGVDTVICDDPAGVVRLLSEEPTGGR